MRDVAAQRREVDGELGAVHLPDERARQRVDQVARDETGTLRRLDRGALLRGRGGRCGELRLHSLGEERGNDAGQHVAGARGRERRQPERATTSTPRPGAATSVSGPLSTTTQPNRSAASRTLASRCAAISFDSRPSRRAELALVRREHARRRPVGRLELEERVRVDDDRQLELGEQRGERAPSGRDRDRGPARARPPTPFRKLEHDVGAPSATSPSSSGSGRFTASSRRCSSTGIVDSGAATVT